MEVHNIVVALLLGVLVLTSLALNTMFNDKNCTSMRLGIGVFTWIAINVGFILAYLVGIS